jgi:PAS domain S-box-containing protein
MHHVLIVDDDELKLARLRDILGSHGYRVDEAHDGTAALARARQTRPDLVIADVLMPMMDGYTLLRHWKSDATLRATPFVIHSANFTEAKDERLARDLGADGFIAAPVEPQALLRQVQRVLERARRGDTPAAAPAVRDPREIDRSYHELLVAKLEEKARALTEANRQLRASESHCRQLFEANPQPMWVYDLETLRFLAVNQAAIAHYGYSREEFLAMTIADIRPAEDVPRLLAEVRQSVDARLDHGSLWRHRRRDGSLIDVEIKWNRIDFNGSPAKLVLANDVTARLRAERALARINRLHAMLSHTNQLLLRADHRMALFDGICRVAVERGGFRFAWIGLADADGEVHPVARAGDDAGYIDAVRASADASDERGSGPIGRALRTGTNAVVNDFLGSAATTPWHDAARRVGVGAVAALPIRKAGQVIGTINLYAAEMDFFNANELATLSDMALDVSFGLDMLAHEEERAQLLAELESAELRWRYALEGAGHGVWEWNAQTGRMYFSPQWKRMLGLDDAAVGEALSDWQGRIHPDDLAQVQAEIDRHFTGATPQYRSEHRLRGKDGQYRWILDQGRVMTRTPDGRPLLVIGTHTDITDRKLTEERLRDSEARFRAAFEQASVGMAYTSAEGGRWLLVNQCFCDLLGYTREELLACSFSDVTHPDDYPHDAELAQRILRGEVDSYVREKRYLRKDGQAVWASVTATLVRRPDGTPDYFAGVIVDITERKRAEALTRELSDRLRHYLTASPGITYALAVEGAQFVPEWVSGNVERLLGYTVEQVLDPGWWPAHVHPDDFDTALRAVPRLLSGGADAHEYRIRRADGTWIWISDQLRVERDAAGTPLRIVGAWTDVTDRHEMQQQLAASERRFRAAFEQASVGMAHTLPDGRRLMVNQRFADMLGYTREELLARTVEKVTHPDDYARDLELAQRVIGGAVDSYAREKRYLRKDGQILWAKVSTTLVRNADGTPDYFAGVIVDITERKRAEQTLRQLSQAVEQTSEAIVITDAHGTIEYVNDSFVRVSGYSRDDVLGRNPRMLQSGRTPRATYEAMWAALSAGRPWSGEFDNRRKDGSLYIESATISPIRQPDGQVTHYVAVKEDVTEKRRIAEELEHHRHRLEQRVAERTAELQEARRLADAANEAKSAFIANMSHEIRTPMNGVLGMLEVLEQGQLTERQADMVRTARDSGRTLLGIIDDILDFSKIEAGRLQIERVPMSVADVVETLCESLLPIAMQKQVDLSVFVAPDIPARVLSDPLRLRQILFNLIGNAIKFSAGRPDRAGRVAVRVTVAQRAPLRLALTVIDNGIGIAAEHIAQLFVAFTQAEVSTTRRFGGTGLGLAVCKRLADLMGGQISVTSTLGAGSTFMLTLPVDAPAEQPAREPPLLAGVDCVVDETGEFDVDGICAYLEHAGARVHRAAGARDCARIAASLASPVVAIRHAGAALPSAAPTQPLAPNVRLLLITRGRRRKARIASPHMVTLDGSALRRDALLAAVAIAAGRASSDRIPEPARVAPSTAVLSGRCDPILVAEDDEVNQQVILMQLQLLGHKATVARNGTEALQLWRAERFALLLTDLHMPEMDGYELARAIRREEAQRAPGTRLPIVALTANALRGEAERARALGMDDYLTKPLQLEQLRDALARWLVRDAAPSAAALDLAVLKNTIGDDPAQVPGFLSFFLSTARKQAGEISAAAQSSDAAKAGATAHKLKSSARAVGALALGELCAELEQCGKAGELDALRARLPAFDAELARVQAQIDALLGAAQT